MIKNQRQNPNPNGSGGPKHRASREALTGSASSVTLRTDDNNPQHRATTSHMDALRLSMLSDVRDLYGTR